MQFIKFLTKIFLSKIRNSFGYNNLMQNWLHKSFIICLVAIEAGVIAGFWMWTEDSRAQHNTQSEKNRKLTQAQRALESKIAGQLAYRDALAQDRNFLEGVARDKLGYARPDEFIFIIPEQRNPGFQELE